MTRQETSVKRLQPAPAIEGRTAISHAAPKLYVHLRHGLDADTYRQQWLRGRAPDETPYGFHRARELGYSVTFSSDTVGDDGPPLLRRLQASTVRLDLLHVWRNRAKIREADVVWTMIETDAMAVAMLMRLRLIPRRPLIGSVVWLVNDWDHTPRAKQRLSRWLLAGWSRIAVHSVRCRDRAMAIFPDLPMDLLHFGVASDTFQPREEPEDDGVIRIVSMGNDRSRDWETLLKAFGNDDRFHLTIVCMWLAPDLSEPYRNVTVIRDADLICMKRLYASATYSVTSMFENIYSGITVALESAAIGVPQIASDTGAMRTYFDESEVLLVATDDPEAMKRAALSQTPDARRAMAHRARRKFEHADYSTLGMMQRYHQLTHIARG